MNYRYILFDLDGTLSDSAPGVMGTFEMTLRKMGLTPPGREVLIRYVGPPLAETFSDVFGFHGEKLSEVLSVFREFYRDIGITNQKIYNGVPEMLERLRTAGKVLAIATSKGERLAQQVCDRFGISQYFVVIAGSSEDGGRTKKEQVIEYALAQMGVGDRSEVLMVGDRFYDVEGARHCGIDCMGVLHGYGGVWELEGAGAKYLASAAKDVADMILD